MRTREPRRKVLIRARMRVAEGWHDACILDLSSRGAGLQAAEPPMRGTFLEIRRGQHVIIARVVWCRGHRFGIRSQDRLAIESIASDTDATEEPSRAAPVERRRTVRRPTSHGTSRRLARRIEFAAMAAAVIGGAMLVGGMIYDQLSRPLASVALALAGKG